MVSVTQNSSTARLGTDPLRNFKFHVQVNHPGIAGFASLGFMSATGLGITTEIIPYRQGGDNTTTRKMPGQSDFAPLTLTKGLMVGDSHMFNWMKELFAVMQGTGTGSPGKDFRHTVDVQVLDHPVTTASVPVKAWYKFYNAWPTSVSFSDLDAGSNAIIVQQMVLAHEGFDFKIANQAGTDSVDL